MLNRIIIMGRLARDPELRHTQSGTEVASFTLAVDRDFKDKSTGERTTDWIDVVAWRNTATFVSKYFSKGRMAIVEGHLQIRDWTDKEGRKRRNAEVVADNVTSVTVRRMVAETVPTHTGITARRSRRISLRNCLMMKMNFRSDFGAQNRRHSMLKMEKTKVCGIEEAIRGMRNPKNSWDRSDSNYYDDAVFCDELTASGDRDCANCAGYGYIVGENDYSLMLRLAQRGPVHAKYRRMITVYVDITAPLYWWKEFDTYKVGTVASSCSTMHKIHAKEFELDDFSHEHLSNFSSHPEAVLDPISILKMTITTLNSCRKEYHLTKDKFFWWQMIQLLPSSYNQRRTVMLNYEVLAGIYQHRRNHKLDEWHTFCGWIEGLPYSEIITCTADRKGNQSST